MSCQIHGPNLMFRIAGQFGQDEFCIKCCREELKSLRSELEKARELLRPYLVDDVGEIDLEIQDFLAATAPAEKGKP